MINIALKIDTLKEKFFSAKQKPEYKDNVIDITSRLNQNKKANVIDIKSGYKKSNKGNKRNKKNKKSKFDITTIVIAIAIVVFIIFIIWAVFHKNAYEIYIGDTPVGIIKEKGIEKSLSDTAIAELKEAEGTEIQLNGNYTVTSKFVRASKKDLVTPEYVKTIIKEKMTYLIQASVISVDGKEIGILKNEAEINQTLDKLKELYKLEDVEIKDVGFVEEYNISSKFVNKNELMASDDLYNKLISEVEVPEIYSVQSGDSLSVIASKNNTSLSKLLETNPSISADTVLKIGQELNVLVPKPLLSVKSTVQIKETQSIPCETEYQNDDTQYKNYKNVIQEGKDGSKEITTNIIYINGKEQSREQIDEQIISEPTPNIISVGTKALPAKSATGNFIRPISGGKVTSYFTSNHIALDIAAPHGTLIYASDGGTVKKAGPSGSYGNLVVVDHGNGFETYYAHCSSINVSVGQKVGKGEKIAGVGRTGYATGNHVHFEIRKNGVIINPFDYLG